MDGNHGDAELRDVLLDVEFACPGLRGRQQAALRGVGRVLEAFVGAIDAHQHLGLVIPRSHFFVGHRPVEAEAVTRTGLEIVRAVAERDASPVVRATSQHAGPPPVEALRRIVGGLRVRLPRDLPPSVDGGVVEAERLLTRGHAAQRRLGAGLEHRGLGERVVVTSGLKHEHLHAVHGERVGGLTAAGAGSDDDHVIDGLQFLLGDDRHGDGADRRMKWGGRGTTAKVVTAATSLGSRATLSACASPRRRRRNRRRPPCRGTSSRAGCGGR